jgi:nucleoside-diphosphate-sugar epimerase
MSKILVTGGEGLIGTELVKLLEKDNEVFILDLKNGDDITDYKTCLKYCQGMDEVYHVFGIKGSPKRTKEKPAEFMIPMLQGDTNMIRASQECKVKKFLYTSSIAVLFPESDFYPAWAKQTAEHLIKAIQIQGTETKFCIVRPANVYGKESLEGERMVISNLLKKAKEDEQIEVWGDGTQERDFIHARDVARIMIETMKQMPNEPINATSGKTNKISEVADILSKLSNKPIKYDITKPTGPSKKFMPNNLHLINYLTMIELNEGIKEIW